MSDIPKESPRSILFQFVFFPLGIVVVAVGVFYLFGRLATSEQNVPDYLNQIKAGSSHERWQAAYQLSKSIERGEAKKYPALEPQVEALYKSSKQDDPRIRRYLSVVLGRLRDRRATPLLLEGLHDADIENRIYALLGLGELRDPSSVPQVAVLLGDSEKDIRKTAAYALGEIGDASAVPPLLKALDDAEPEVRYNAALAVSRFNDPRALPALHEMLDRTRLDRLSRMSEEQKEDAMIMAMAPYARLGGREASADLQRIAASDKSLRVRAAAKSAAMR